VALASRHAIPAINLLQGAEMNETSRIKELPRLPPSKTVLGIGRPGPHAHACVAFVAERFDGAHVTPRLASNHDHQNFPKIPLMGVLSMG
jgi:hypothetical protein